MMARRSVLGLLAGGATAMLSGCGLFGGNSGRLRYRITVEIETPTGLKTGSSVLEEKYPSKTGLSFGQAPMVDLGDGRYVFALINKGAGPSTIFRYKDLQPPMPPRDDIPWSEYEYANDIKPFGVIKRDDYPMLVTFDDINDPKTVREFDPGAVRRITFQVVDEDESLTEGIEKRLVWLGEGSPDGRLEKRVPGSSLAYTEDTPLSRKLSKITFVWRKK